MKKLIILFRSLFKNRTTSLITITGFSVSISMALILIAFLIYEFGIDRDYPNINNIYRVFANENVASVREDLREQILKNYPEIEDACRYNFYTTTVTRDNAPFNGSMISTDASFFNIFSIQFIEGNATSALTNPDNVVLTKSFAEMIFGEEDPLGKTLIAEYRNPLTVSGIIKDFPANSSIRGDFITDSRNKIKYEGTNDGQGNQLYYFRLFILTHEDTDINNLENLITANVSSVIYNQGYPVEQITLVPFKSSYFMQGINRSQTLHANIKLIRLLLLITSAIILLAIFNYINLTTASHTDRYKEIAIKKTIGASGSKIFVQFISESYLICFVSFLIALMLISLWLPFFEKFLGKSIDLSLLFRPGLFLFLILGISIIAFMAGIYPALAISRLRPIRIITKRESAKKGSISLRAVLNVFQNIVSISLIIALLVISRQINYVRTKDFGFDTDRLLRVDVHWRLADKKQAIRDRLLQEPTISDVCFSHGTPGSIYSYSSWLVDGRQQRMNDLTVDSSFFKVFRIPIIMGREFHPSEFNKVCYVNETALKTSGWNTFEGQSYHGMQIIGVVKDFNYANMYNMIAPLNIAISDEMGVSHLTLRINPANLPRAINALKETWKEVCPGHELNYQFYDDWLDSMYKSEERLSAAVRLFAVLAILISCLGIIGLAEFSIKRRTKEIGLRKVNGATISQVMVLLNFDFVRWVLFAICFSTPVAYFMLNKWLTSFAYKAGLSWWIFFAGGIIALSIAGLTVSWQSWRAAKMNPVEALRYE